MFGQGSYAFTDKLTLTLGARYTDEEKVFTPESLILLDDGLTFNSAFIQGNPLPPGQEYGLTGTRLFTNPTTIKSDETTPYANLAYAFTDTLNVFFTYSEGCCRG